MLQLHTRGPRSMLAGTMAVVVAPLVPAPAGAQCEWRTGPAQAPSGLVGAVSAATVWDPDGVGPLPIWLVVGGYDLQPVGGPAGVAIAKYDGTGWSPIGTGGPDFEVRALTVFNGDLIAAGSFLPGYIARFDGTAWFPLGAGLDGSVNALTVVGGALYAAGIFMTAGGVPAARVACWDGVSWSPLGEGIDGAGDYPLAMAGFLGSLYVGGNITMAGGQLVSNLAVWNGSEWFDEPVDGTVRALAVRDNGVTLPTLVVGGSFTAAGGLAVQNIARLSALGAWSGFGGGLNRTVTGLHVRNSGLSGYTVAATLQPVSGADTDLVRQSSGGAWATMGSFPAGTTPSCVVFHDFRYTVGSGSPGACAFDGTSWVPIGPGLSGRVRALQTLGTDLIFGGDFEFENGVRVNHVARWNGTSFARMDNGMNGAVRDLAVLGNDLYAAGDFTVAGSAATIGIARWNGAAWEAAGLPGAPDGPVEALGVFEGDLVVGGLLDSGQTVRCRTGGVWQPMSTGLAPSPGRYVQAFATWNGDLYAGATLPIQGTAIARWNAGAQTWLGVAPLGALPDHAVRSLLPFGSELWAAGQRLGYSPSSGVHPLATVNPFSFFAVSTVGGLGGQPFASTLTVYNGALHVSGVFDQVSGAFAQGFARLGSSEFEAVSSIDGGVAHNAAAVYQNELVLGGTLIGGGGGPKHRWLRWHCPPPCYPDCNASNSLTIADFGCFQAKFVAGDPYADCNASGSHTIADFGCFQAKFVAACP